MSSQTDPVVCIQELVRTRHYRIGLHAVRHMVEEGFDENQLLEAVKRKTMKDFLRSGCSECGGAVRSRTITQEFEREGLRVSVSGIRALVCTKCEAVYFEPGGAQALVEAVNGLFALAKRNRQHKGKLAGAI